MSETWRKGVVSSANSVSAYEIEKKHKCFQAGRKHNSENCFRMFNIVREEKVVQMNFITKFKEQSFDQGSYDVVLKCTGPKNIPVIDNVPQLKCAAK